MFICLCNISINFFAFTNKKISKFAIPKMVDVAQLVRALDCGSRGRRFEPGLPPADKKETDNIWFPFFAIISNNYKL